MHTHTCNCTSSPAAGVPDGAYLSEYSPRDAVWDVHRSEAQAVEAIYASVDEFERYAQRIRKCSGFLRFAWVVDTDTGELTLRLREAEFCRVRHCPVCQWRRSLMWLARFYEALPRLELDYPAVRWLFLTLTVRNCDVRDLRATLRSMNQSWHRFVKLREFRQVLGWVRTTEVTRGIHSTAHPHFHCLLMVPPGYFKGGSYITQSRWVQLWRQAARLDYDPVVDVRVVKCKGLPVGSSSHHLALRHAAAETLKYAVKPSDMVADPDWFLELTRQVHRLRFIATGGALKDVLREDEETNEDLILADDPSPGVQDLSRVAFRWRRVESRYRRYPKGDMYHTCDMPLSTCA